MHCHSLLLSPEALAPAAFCCRCHHRLPASSASVLLSVPLPATDGYRFGPRHSRIILPEPHAFRAFTAELSRIAAFNFRREPVACTSQSLPHQHWPSGKGKKPLALRDPATNFALGEISTVRPFALATALLVVSLLGWSVGLTPSPEYVYFRAFSRQGRPCRLPDMTMAPYWDLRQRDFHPQVQQLASLHCLRLTVPPAGPVEDLACSAHAAPPGESPCRAHHKKDSRRGNPRRPANPNGRRISRSTR